MTEAYQKKYGSSVILLIAISTIVRAFLAATLELGNDEVYYVLYARYPDWSHFDHPLMVGFMIQLFSLNLLFESELFIRLSSIVIGAINIWLMFQIGKTIKSERVGFIATTLYVASIYSSVIAGIFILPDTPQSLFWLLSVFLMIKILPSEIIYRRTGLMMLLLGCILGLGILSKYTTVYLWLGMGLYFLFYKREWFKSPYLYLALLITAIVSSPILFWNYQNEWVSFAFQSGRVSALDFTINFNYFISESIGEILYNNPINFVLIALTLLAYLNGKLYINISYLQIILLATLPLIATFLLVSFSRSTLPHWSAPSYTTLLIVVAVWLDQWKNQKLAKRVLLASNGLLILVLILGYMQVNLGLISFDQDTDYHRLGKNDPSLDLYGYDQVGKAFSGLVEQDISNKTMPFNSVLVGDNWFPLANFDYYAASPIDMSSYGLGPLENTHKYAWINQVNGGFKKGMSAYYITDSRYYRLANNEIISCFEQVELADTIQVYRSGKIAKRAFVYRLKNMVKIPEETLPTSQ